ncbi:MAG: tRNA (guanine-N(1)-)-methyltransferase [Amphiamblys sp. WSBS2006]|nr:MAG: tRNA (guanine-N(1)-)-methyltransferase [Amphiamblys sp. WSBS2006]
MDAEGKILIPARGRPQVSPPAMDSAQVPRCLLKCRRDGVLRKEDFGVSMDFVGVVCPREKIVEVLSLLQTAPSICNTLPRISCVVETAEKEKAILLAHTIRSPEEIPPDRKTRLDSLGLKTIQHTVTLGYKHWKFAEVVDAILPAGLKRIASFECAGRIAHLNLEREHLPFRHTIGKILLEKTPNIKTVLNKTAKIENKFRVLPMEILAGSNDTVVRAKENDCVFVFDYATVYWNSRLQREHYRLVSSFKPGEVVCDVFCGVGPFAIPAAKRGCTVYANDLNPHAYAALLENSRRNKVTANIHCYCLDGAEFIEKIDRLGKEEGFTVAHYVLNLPQSSCGFLGLFATPSQSTVHVYLFAGCVREAEEAVQTAIGREMGGKKTAHVRRVSPKTVMYCVSFQ